MVSVLTPDTRFAQIQSQYKENLQHALAAHRAGEDARELVRQLTETTDNLVLLTLKAFMKEILGQGDLPAHILLLAQGGYGRRELHPRSDIDLIFLYQNTLSAPEQELVKALFRTLFDFGFQVGHCCRSFKEALETATKDDQSRTAMSESRFLAGDYRLFERFKLDFWKTVSKNKKEYIRRKIEERQERNARHGTTINISEPHIKESPGGLRDYHFGLWLGSLVQGQTLNLLHLCYHHFITDAMMKKVQDALSFLWRLRNDLHFTTGKEQDVLLLTLQNELSQRLGYQDQRGRLSEEQMMRDYYKHALSLLEFADHMQQKCTPQPVWDYLRFKHKKALPGGFALFDRKIHTPPDLNFFEHHPPRLVQIFLHAAQYNAPLSDEALTAIRDNLHLADQAFLHHKETADLLRAFFALPGKIEPALQAIRKTGLLECLFPEWKDIANLVRYDLIHRFTVDEHSFLCLYHLDNLATDTVSHAKEREQIWRQIQKKDVLRLAILFHDIGKGRNGDHSILGARLIETIAQRLRYEESDINQMVFLVLNHLLMSHTAQHRDLADPQVTADFVDTFESAEQINMMYLLTFVDMHSVSPEAMTEWKNNLLWQLYTTAREFLLGDSFDAEDPCRAMSPTEQTCQELCAEFEPELVQSHLAKLPRSYSLYQGLNTIRQHLEMVRIFDGETPLIRFYPHVDPACRDMVMVYKDKIGLFNTICTSVLLENFNIEEARLNTRADGIVANNIVIRDALGQTDIPESRQSLLKERLNRLLISDAPPPPVPKSIGRSKIGRISFENHAKIFNDSSARFTVIVVRCVDRRGLLQDLTSVLTEKNINIHFARIITEGNRVTDVFYVADPQGNKITDQDTLIQLQQNLLGMLSLNHNE